MIGALFAAAAPASAQQYPTRTVTIIVPYPAGGPTDETARVVAQSLATKLKQSFIVENLSGGNTIVGLREGRARRARRLHAVVAQSADFGKRDALFKNLPFDTVKDFTPVMLINRNPLVLVGRTTLAAEQRSRN